MKIRLTFGFNFGVFWDKRLGTLHIFPLPMIGVRIYFAKVTIAALPPSDAERLLDAVGGTYNALWTELCAAAGLTGQRAAVARQKLLEVGLVEERRVQFTDSEGQVQSRRVLARTGARR